MCLLLSELVPAGTEGPRRLARVKSVQYEREDGKLNASKLGIDRMRSKPIRPQELLDTIRDIEHTSGVISANMVFHQLDEEEGS